MDVDADAWASAVVAAGGPVSNAQIQSLHDFNVGAKADGFYSKLNFLWPFYCDVTQGADIDVITRLAGTRVGTPTWASKGGMSFNGSSSYFNCNTTGGTAQDLASFGFDLQTNLAASDYIAMGASDSGHDFICNISPKWSDGTLYFAINDLNTDAGRAGPSNVIGFYAIVRVDSTTGTVYIEGSSFATNGQGSFGTPTTNYCVGASFNLSGAPFYFCAGRFDMAFIGDDLTATNVANLRTRWNAYKSALANFVDRPSSSRVFLGRQPAVIRAARY